MNDKIAEKLLEMINNNEIEDIKNELLEQIDSDDKLKVFMKELLEQIKIERKKIEELQEEIIYYRNAIDILADAVGNATGDLVGDELIDY